MANTIVREIAPKSIFEDASAMTSSTADFEQGDLLIFNTTSKKIEKPALEADCATFLGIARVTVVDGKIKSPYQGTAVDAAQAIVTLPGPVYGVIAKVICKTGDAFPVGCLVYADPSTGPQAVSATGTKAIGLYQGPAVSSATAGQVIEVLIGARYPTDALAF